MRSYKKALSNLVVFIIGVIILLTTLVPLFMFLTSSRTDIEKIIRGYEDFQNLRDLEKLSVEADYTSSTPEMFYLRNTGSIPIKIVRSVIQDSSGIYYYTNNLLIDVGQRIPLKQIFDQLGLSYDPIKLKYVVTARGSVFFIADQIIKLSIPQYTSPGGGQGSGGAGGGTGSQPSGGFVGGSPFIPPSSLFYWNFSNAIKNNRMSVNYSKSSANCDITGISWVGKISNYPNNVSTVNESGTAVVTFDLQNKKSGCASFIFKNLLDVSGSYVVVIYYRIIVSTVPDKNKSDQSNQTRVSVNLTFGIISNDKLLSSSVTTFEWAPKSNTDYLVYSGYTVIPVFNPETGQSVVSGQANLLVSIVLTQINSKGDYQVGIEYLAFQGVVVNPVPVG